MPREESLSNVPANDVGDVVQSFIADGAVNIEAKQTSGGWVIIATFN